MAGAEKIDLFKGNKEEYAATQKPRLVRIAKAQYLCVAGRGAPGGDDFQKKIGALYAAAFTIKMTRKFGGLEDYTVCKLEGLYGSEEGGDEDYSRLPRDKWRWDLAIRTPDFVKAKDLKDAYAALMKRGKADGVEHVRLEHVTEGLCVQMLHVGPYDKIGESVEIMRSFADEQGYAFQGRHHDVYLSDPRRVPPERLKSILRRPVKKV